MTLGVGVGVIRNRNRSRSRSTSRSRSRSNRSKHDKDLKLALDFLLLEMLTVAKNQHAKGLSFVWDSLLCKSMTSA